MYGNRKMYLANCVTFLLCVLLVDVIEVALSFSSCQQLQLDYTKNGPDRVLTVFGRERLLSVYYEESDPSRAAAALLFTAFKYGLRYQHVRMRTLPQTGLCGLQEQQEVEDQDRQEIEVIVAPSISWNETAPSTCASEKESETEPLLVLGAGAAPVSLNTLPTKGRSNSDAIRTIRVAEISTLRRFAPSVLEVFGRFSPSPNNIRQLLNSKNENPGIDLEESACKWALNNVATFNNWLRITRKRLYEVAVFLCSDDSDDEKNDYVKVINDTFQIHNRRYADVDSKFNLVNVATIYYVNCSNEYSLMKGFMEQAQSVYSPRLIGAVGCGAGFRAATSVASALNIALVQYDVPVPGDVSPSSSSRSTNGRLQHLLLGYQHFLASCRWTRLAVISEDTKFASIFVTSLSAQVNLTVRDVSIIGGVKTALSTLVKEKARIILINANPDIASTILCVANELGHLTDTSYVWILREWKFQDLKCTNYTILENKFLHYTISFWWRGGDVSLSSLDSSQNIIRNRELESLWNKRRLPMKATPLIDAVTILLQGFHNLLQSRSYSIDDLHSEVTNRKFWESYDSNPALGVVQQLNLRQGTLSHPFIYIYNSRGKLEAVWQVYDDHVDVKYQPRPFFDDMYPSDGHTSCWITSSDNQFLPACHDTAYFTGFAMIIIAIPAALLARRARQQLIAYRDRELTARLLARGRRASAALAAHLVDRSFLEFGRELGTGRFGRVSLAVLRLPGKPPLVVAAKALRDEATKTEEHEFLNEAVTLASLHHEHVVRLIGVCATGGPPLVLMEHAFFGDLLQYLRERRYLVKSTNDARAETEHVSAPALTRMARQAAIALDYLRQQRFVHRDVRASNCLIDARRSLKLADFGLARKTESGAQGGDEEYMCRRSRILPVMWMAPESLKRGVFTAASDAWALGVLLLELATLGARPYGDWVPERVMRYVAVGGHPPLPKDITPDLRRILLQCWRREPKERASAAELARELTCSPEAVHPALGPLESIVDDYANSTTDLYHF